jgi:hypothetical protein
MRGAALRQKAKAPAMAVLPLPSFLRGTSAPDPTRQPLMALLHFLRHYLALGKPDCKSLPPPSFNPLPWHLWGCFHTDGYVSTLLTYLLPGFLLFTKDRRRQHKRAYGGRWARRDSGGRLRMNRFSQRDLKQKPYDLPMLDELASEDLCRLLYDDLRILVRLLLTAQRAFWGAPAGSEWSDCHRAVVVVLVRIVQVCARLRERGSRFLAEACLREQARELWLDLFGPDALALAPTWVAERLAPLQAIEAWGQQRIIEQLQLERPLYPPLLALLIRCEEAVRV